MPNLHQQVLAQSCYRDHQFSTHAKSFEKQNTSHLLPTISYPWYDIHIQSARNVSFFVKIFQMYWMNDPLSFTICVRQVSGDFAYMELMESILSWMAGALNNSACLRQLVLVWASFWVMFSKAKVCLHYHFDYI